MFGKTRIYCGFRIYKTDNNLSDIVDKIIKSDNRQVYIKVSDYCTEIKFDNEELLRFWSTNKFYAYASEGFIERSNDVVVWKDKMLSRKVTYDLFEYVEKAKSSARYVYHVWRKTPGFSRGDISHPSIDGSAIINLATAYNK